MTIGYNQPINDQPINTRRERSFLDDTVSPDRDLVDEQRLRTWELRQMARCAFTPGILEGLELRGIDGPTGLGSEFNKLVVHPGTAVADTGRLLHVVNQIEIDLTPLLDPSHSGHSELILSCDLITGAGPAGRSVEFAEDANPGLAANHGQPASGPRISIHRSGTGFPTGGVWIATVNRISSTTLQVLPVRAGLGGRRLSVGSPGGSRLAVDASKIVARGTVNLLGGGSAFAQDDGCLVLGSTTEANVVIDENGIDARTQGGASELHIQRRGGGTRFGGPLHALANEPLAIVGGSDLSLGGGGILMLGRESEPNLVFDENEIMARDNGGSVPLTLQWDGGETRIGGPLRGPADGPLNVVGGRDFSLAGEGVLMLGPKDGHHLALDENEILARDGENATNLYLQWHGGGTFFGGPLRGPDNRPLTIVGEREATLGDGGGYLVVGAEDGPNLTFDHSTIMARRDRESASLGLQPEGGTTRFGGPIELAVGGANADVDPDDGRSPAWQLLVGSDAGRADLEFRRAGELVGWMEPDRSGLAAPGIEGGEDAEVSELADVVDMVRRLRPSMLTADDGRRTTLGFVAEEIREVAPNLVCENDGRLGFHHSDFAVIAIAAIKEQQHKIDELEETIASLAGRLDLVGSGSGD